MAEENETNSGELDRDKDVITPEEFEKLEKQENKKSLLKKLFSKEEKKEEVKTEEEKPEILTVESLSFEFHQISKKLDDLMVTVEMQGGKLDMEKELRSAMNERILDLSSQLGELRSMLISKERFFDKIENEFTKFQDMIKLVDPQKIQEEFDKKELELTKIDAKAEKNFSKIDTLQKEIDHFSKQMTKLGSFEDLIQTLEQLDSKIKEVMNAKNQAEQTLVKIEALYLELNKKAELIDEVDSSTKTNQNKISDVERKLNKLANKLETVPKKEDVENIKKHIDVVRENVFEKEMSALDLKKFEDELKKHSEMIKKFHSQMSSEALKKQLYEELKTELYNNMKNKLKEELRQELSGSMDISKSVNPDPNLNLEQTETVTSPVESSMMNQSKVSNEDSSEPILAYLNQVKAEVKDLEKIKLHLQKAGWSEDQIRKSIEQYKKLKELKSENSESPINAIKDHLPEIDSLKSPTKNDDENIKSLIDFLKEAKTKNMNFKKVEEKLLQVGWTKEQIEKAKEQL